MLTRAPSPSPSPLPCVLQTPLLSHVGSCLCLWRWRCCSRGGRSKRVRSARGVSSLAARLGGGLVALAPAALLLARAHGHRARADTVDSAAPLRRPASPTSAAAQTQADTTAAAPSNCSGSVSTSASGVSASSVSACNIGRSSSIGRVGSASSGRRRRRRRRGGLGRL